MSSDDETCTFYVVRTSDAKRHEMNLPLSTKLGELKTMLSEEEYFGLPETKQRIFHLGREWKSAGRTLAKLGLGKFNNFVLHLQTRPGSDSKEQASTSSTKTQSQRKQQRIATSSSRSTTTASMTTTRGRGRAKNNNETIDLLSDSDDEVVEVTGVSSTSRNNKRRRVS